MGYSEFFCLIFKYLKTFHTSFIDVQQFHCGQRTYFNITKSFKFMQTYFVVQNMVYLGECSMVQLQKIKVYYVVG